MIRECGHNRGTATYPLQAIIGALASSSHPTPRAAMEMSCLSCLIQTGAD
jgi:hypothetical protein